MLFTSLEFLFLFLPVTLMVYFILPGILRNYWLLVVSLFFYGWGEPVFLAFMIASIVFNYLMALWIDQTQLGSWSRRTILVLDILGNLSVLFVYKYMNFVTATIHAAIPQTQRMFEVTKFVLPIGISFFTFQAMSYVIDVYRGEERGAAVQKNPAYVGLYVSFFPQLIAGPIVRYTTVEQEIMRRSITVDSFSEGVYRFLLGFNKKMLLANTLAEVADKAFAVSEPSVSMAWLGIVCYTLQIFFDFGGYSEMAIGLGKMFGFNFLENFDYPYISKTITEFWRRWHMSLGTWFRDYVYFPLGGSRVKSKYRLVFNLFVVWLLTGVWHGANWTFILWGVLYGVILTIEKLLDLPKRLSHHGVASVGYRVFTLLAVMLGWVLFRSVDLFHAWKYIQIMFGMSGNALIDDMARFYFREYFVLIVVGLTCSTPVFRIISGKLTKNRRFGEVAALLTGILQLMLFVVGISQLVMNAHNPFIYFNF